LQSDSVHFELIRLFVSRIVLLRSPPIDDQLQVIVRKSCSALRHCICNYFANAQMEVLWRRPDILKGFWRNFWSDLIASWRYIGGELKYYCMNLRLSKLYNIINSIIKKE